MASSTSDELQSRPNSLIPAAHITAASTMTSPVGTTLSKGYRGSTNYDEALRAKCSSMAYLSLPVRQNTQPSKTPRANA